MEADKPSGSKRVEEVKKSREDMGDINDVKRLYAEQFSSPHSKNHKLKQNLSEQKKKKTKDMNLDHERGHLEHPLDIHLIERTKTK